MLHTLLEAKRKQGNTLVKTAAENIFVNKTGLKPLTFEFGKVPHSQLWLFIIVEDKRSLETSLKNVMFHPAHSPNNTAPLTVISHCSPQEMKRTWGKTLPGREMVALHMLEERLWAQLHAYSPAGVARATRALLSAEPHRPHKPVSFQPFWAHSSSFSAKSHQSQQSYASR